MLFCLQQVKGDVTSCSFARADGAGVMSRLAEALGGSWKNLWIYSKQATSEDMEVILYFWLARSLFKRHPSQHEVPLHGLSHNKIKLSGVREDNISFHGPVGNDNLLPNIHTCWERPVRLYGLSETTQKVQGSAVNESDSTLLIIHSQPNETTWASSSFVSTPEVKHLQSYWQF